MTRWAFTGTRPPPERFTPAELDYTRHTVLHHVQPGDEVGVGCCVGVDEEVAGTIILHNAAHPTPPEHIRLVLFLPRDKRQVARRLIPYADEVHDDDRDFLDRDGDLVAWAEQVIGIALYDEHRQPRSGTWATVRMARRAGKLRDALVLRPES